MLIVVLGLVTLLTFRGDRKGPELEAGRRTALALAQAKEALLGRAASDGDPGTLTCASDDNSGGAPTTILSGTGGAISCITRFGWYPWKKLSIGELRDGSNSNLWYFFGAGYVDRGTYSPAPNVAGLNLTIIVVKVDSQTLDETVVTTTTRTDIAAIIFSPGVPLGSQGQDRGGVAASDYTYANQYLEGVFDTATDAVTIKIEQNNNPPIKYNDRFLMVTQREVLDRASPAVASNFTSLLPSTLPSNGWIPTTGDWEVIPPPSKPSRYQGWANPSLTLFSNNGTPPATLTFANCDALFQFTDTATGYQVKRSGRC